MTMSSQQPGRSFCEQTLVGTGKTGSMCSDPAFGSLDGGQNVSGQEQQLTILHKMDNGERKYRLSVFFVYTK
jgi:hypothetical protein